MTASMMQKMYDVRLQGHNPGTKGACRVVSSSQSSMAGLDGMLSCARLSMTCDGMLFWLEIAEQVVSVLHREGQDLQYYCQ